jgi:hypothetical protein
LPPPHETDPRVPSELQTSRDPDCGVWTVDAKWETTGSLEAHVWI